jgi:hypothetical protein
MSTFHGRFALGQKTDSLQEPGLLGDERDDIAMRYDSATDMYYVINSGRVTTKWVKNTSGAALAPGSLVSYNVSGNLDTEVVGAVTATTVCGIVDPFLTSDVAIGESFLMVTKASRLPGVKVNVGVTKGDRLVQHATNGTAIAGAGTALRALETGSGSVACMCNFTAI